MTKKDEQIEQSVFGLFGRINAILFTLFTFGGFTFCIYLLTEKTNTLIVLAVAFIWSIVVITSLIRMLEDTVIDLADNEDWVRYIYARKKLPASWLTGWAHKSPTKAS